MKKINLALLTGIAAFGLTSCTFKFGSKSSSTTSSSEVSTTQDKTSEETSASSETSSNSVESSDSIEETSPEPIESSDEDTATSQESITDESSVEVSSSEESSPIESSSEESSSEESIESSSEIDSSSEVESSSEESIEDSSSEESSSAESSSSEETSSSESTSESTSEEDKYDASVIFKSSGSDKYVLSSLTGHYEASGVNILTNTCSYVYPSGDGGVKLGSRQSSGRFSFNFSDEYKVDKVYVHAKPYESATNVKLTVTDSNEIDIVNSISSNDLYTFDFSSHNDLIDSITFAATQRLYIYEIYFNLGEVVPVYPTSISLSPTSLTLKEGRSSTLSVSYSPANTNVKEVSFKSSDSTIASVDKDGKVTGNCVGNATITATAIAEVGTISKSVEVEVIENASPAEGEATNIEFNYKDYGKNTYDGLDYCPSNGGKLLVIPVWLTDSSTYISTSKKENVRSDIEKAYFGTESETGWNSVRSYYDTESFGECKLEGTVSEWYSCGYSLSQVTNMNVSHPLVSTAVDWYFKNHSTESRKDYDKDGNGFLDGVMLIYGCPNYVTLNKSNSYKNLWAYCYWYGNESTASKEYPEVNVYFWCSYDFMYDSSTAKSRAGTNYGYGDCSYCTVDSHTFIHEMGHVLGLEDYYDYGNNRYNPAGGFSMQDFNMGGHDPYSVMAYGWADPIIPTESTTISIKPFQETHEMILLTPEWNDYNSPFDEYLLLELYTPTGLNEFDSTHSYQGSRGPTNTGIRLWHVDARLAYSLKTEQVYYSGYGYYDEPVFSANQITTTPYEDGAIGINHAFSNSYNNSDYGSVLGSSYYKYDLLHLIRNDTSTSYLTTSYITNSDLFGSGSSFTMSSYGKQFANTGLLDSKKSLGWSFSVSISGSGSNAVATIDLVRN